MACTSRGCRTSASSCATVHSRLRSCPSCGTATAFEATVVYTDFQRWEYVAAETPRSATWQTALARHQTIDAAFRRRFAYDVQFAFPSAELREDLWRRVFPRRAHVSGLDHRPLAERYELSGGYIKIAAERTAFVAAGLSEPITMAILTDTIDRMYRECGKLSTVGKLE